jgi:hypothetical protein
MQTMCPAWQNPSQDYQSRAYDTPLEIERMGGTSRSGRARSRSLAAPWSTKLNPSQLVYLAVIVNEVDDVSATVPLTRVDVVGSASGAC